MPCYQPSPEYIEGQLDGIKQNAKHHPDDLHEIKLFSQHNAFLVAAMCALLSELDRRGIVADVVTSSSREGLIDIMAFWNHHSNTDETRLAAEIHKYSKDEQRMIKKMLEDLE